MSLDNNKKIYVIIVVLLFTHIYVAIFNELNKFKIANVSYNIATNSEIRDKLLIDETKNNTYNDVSISTKSIIYNYESLDLVAERVKKNKDYYYETIPNYQKIAYKNFIDSVKKEVDYKDKNSGWIRLRNNNDKLIIGCSTAVWCGYTIENTSLERYGYDIIGLGGAFDTDLKNILENLRKNQYKKIVIFGGVNDCNLRAFTGEIVVDPNYASEIANLLDEARRHLLNGVTDIIFVRVKPMTYIEDSDDIEFMLRYNNCALQYNDLLTYLIGVKYYDIPFDTSDKYSSGYVHYDKLEVYKKIFDDINEL